MDSAILIAVLAFAGVIIAALVAVRNRDLDALERKRGEDKQEAERQRAEDKAACARQIEILEAKLNEQALHIMRQDERIEVQRQQADADRDTIIKLQYQLLKMNGGKT